jgi:hypothetical protein
MKSFETSFRNNRVTTMLTQAQALKVKVPSAVLAKLERGKALDDLIKPITNEEITAATTDTIDELIERIRKNATYESPIANTEFQRLRDSLALDLYNTVRGCVFEIYNDVAAKLDKAFAGMNKTAAKVPNAFAMNPNTWEHYDDAARNSLTSLREQAAKLTKLATLLDLLSAEFFPPAPDAPSEIAAIGPLQMFYDFSDLDSPTLARFELPAGVASLSVEMITYLAERGVTLKAQTIRARKDVEEALIAQAQGYAQLDDGRLVPASEAPIRQQSVNAPPAYVNTSMGEVKASSVTPYL